MSETKDWLVPIGARIKEARKELDITQIELAEKAEISVPYLSKIEMGKSDFSISVLIRISEALQISTDKLLRPNIPESNLIANEELMSVMQGCSPAEAASIIETAKNMRKAFTDAKKDKF
ncbi:MAG: helix-turn-helix transcriptional regulator [Ruminococcus sp.]|nr:helix-turn-helix transcriptional regulator [Ruminococcus sp.]